MLKDTSTQTLLAYQVDDDYEGHAVVVFATNGAAARRQGACELEVDFHDVSSCRRVKHFDAYAPGPVPRETLLDAGWWFECAHCHAKVQRDTDEAEAASDPRVDGEHVYCNPACKGLHHAYQRRREAAHAAMAELITMRYPLASAIHVHVYGDRLEAVQPGEPLRSSASFRLPELTYPVTYHFGRRDLFVSQADVDTFRAVYSGSSG